MRGAVEERVRAGPAARRDPGASQFKNRVRSVSIPYHRLVSGLSVCLHTVSSPRVRQRRAAERRAATTAVGARERGAGAAAAAEERAVAGGVAAVFGIACALVKVLCGCRCHRGSRHHSSVTISSPRVRPRRQQNEEQRRLRLERGSEGRAPRRRRRRERWQEEWRRSSGSHVRW